MATVISGSFKSTHNVVVGRSDEASVQWAVSTPFVGFDGVGLTLGTALEQLALVE